jgi:hypothetical protein
VQDFEIAKNKRLAARGYQSWRVAPLSFTRSECVGATAAQSLAHLLALITRYLIACTNIASGSRSAYGFFFVIQKVAIARIITHSTYVVACMKAS